MTLTQQYRAARAVSTPLLCVRTTDQAATIAALVEIEEKQATEERPAPPMLAWDMVRGIQPANRAGSAEMDRLIPPQAKDTAGRAGEIARKTQNPVETLALAQRFSQGAVLYMMNAHRAIDQPAVSQAIWNLRDVNKQDFRTLVLVTPPGFRLPQELAYDTTVLDEPLPNVSQLEQIVKQSFESFEGQGISAPAPDVLSKCTDALLGLSAFPAEQVTMMQIWAIYRKAYSIPAEDPIPADTGWTGAEIKQVCYLAYDLGLPLREAAQYIVPVCQSAGDQINALRDQAAGRFISASQSPPQR